MSVYKKATPVYDDNVPYVMVAVHSGRYYVAQNATIGTSTNRGLTLIEVSSSDGGATIVGDNLPTWFVQKDTTSSGSTVKLKFATGDKTKRLKTERNKSLTLENISSSSSGSGFLYENNTIHGTSTTTSKNGYFVVNTDRLQNDSSKTATTCDKIYFYVLDDTPVPTGLNSKVKVNGSWKDAKTGFIRVNNQWKSIKEIYIKVSGSWHK